MNLCDLDDDSLLELFPDSKKTPEEIRKGPSIKRAGVDIINATAAYPFYRRLKARLGSWIKAGYQIFETKSGNLGIGPPRMQPNDIVAILDRCSTPVVFRSHSEIVGKWILISSRFVPGVMGGEARMEVVSKESVVCFETA